MHVKPSKVPTFTTDESIYAVEGFCAYMNWMCTAFKNMLDDPAVRNGDNGLMVDLTVQDHPVMKVVYV